MKTARILFTVAIVAFLAGFWAACSIGFDVTDQENTFSCTGDPDCIAPYRCRGGQCLRSDDVNCTDIDGDGYGTGDTSGCPGCLSADKCAEDCNDSDEAINPGLLDTCDGKDNNCDGEIDELVPCEDSFDCPDEVPYLAFCEGNVCVYRTPITFGGACNANPVACVGGERETRPDECF